YLFPAPSGCTMTGNLHPLRSSESEGVSKGDRQMGEILRVQNLSFRYPEAAKFAVRDFELTIKGGEIVVLAGPSGCGKSTLLRAVNGLIPHMYTGEYLGSVSVGDDRVSEARMSELAQTVGLLFQNPENQIFMFS